MTESGHVVRTTRGVLVTNPPLARFLFEDTRFSWFWLIVRVLLGLAWIDASLHKLGNPAWMQTGEALKGYWQNAVGLGASAKSSIAFDWYRGFIQGMLDTGAYAWFAKLVAIGEFTVGVCLVLGLFTGIAAFLGGFMNWNFIMAGSASTNPLLFLAAILLILAWKTAGYWGVDRILLPALGTPWNREIVEKGVAGDDRITSTTA